MRNGKTEIKLAKGAPAPIKTNNAGNAQHTRVEEEAKRDKKLAELSFISSIDLQLAYLLHFDHS